MREFDDVRDAKDSGRSRNHLLSVSSVDNESFVSAQDTIADLADFEDLSILQGDLSASVVLKLFATWMSNCGHVTNRQCRPCTVALCSGLGPP